MDRLVELTGWDPELVDEAVARAPDPLRPPASQFVARLAPAGLDPGACDHTSTSARIRFVSSCSRAVASALAAACATAPAGLVDLHERLERDWRSWREVRGL